MADPSARILTISTLLFVIIFWGSHTHAKKTAKVKYGKIKWVTLKYFKTADETPTGIQFEAEGKAVQLAYSGRAKHNGVFYCGRYDPKWKKVHIGTEDGEEAEGVGNNFELLSFPKGTISWVYMLSGDDEPDNAVECGMGDEDYKLSFLCRVVHEKQVLSGAYFMSTKKCVISFNGVHEYSRFEIAVPNMLAMKTQADSDL